MSARRTYRCVIRWKHRKWGPTIYKCAAEGSSIRRAIGNALLAFFSDSTQREQRRDAHVAVIIEAWRVPAEVCK